jgi:hypothetical protein
MLPMTPTSDVQALRESNSVSDLEEMKRKREDKKKARKKSNVDSPQLVKLSLISGPTKSVPPFNIQ